MEAEWDAFMEKSTCPGEDNDEEGGEVTVPHTQEQIDLLSEAKTHGQIFAATGGDHLTSNDIFKGLTLKNRKSLRVKLSKEKTLRQLKMSSLSNPIIIPTRRLIPPKQGKMRGEFRIHKFSVMYFLCID